MHRTINIMSRVNLKWTAYLLHLNTHLPEILINTSRNFHMTVILQLCLILQLWFGASNIIKILTLNFQWMKVHKIVKWTLYSTTFFTSGGAVDNVLVRLSLIEQFIKNVSLIYTQFSVKHPHIFRESWMSLSNISDIYTYFQYVWIPM